MFTADQVVKPKPIGLAADTHSRKVIVTSAVLFQLVWFACVLCPPVVWCSSVVAYFAVYFFIFRCACYAYFILAAACVGIVVDYSLYYFGSIRFTSGSFPLWLISLWFVFVSSIPLAFGFLKQKYWLACLLGGLGGASSYYAASKLREDVSFDFGAQLGFLPLIAVWAILMPVFIYMLEKLGSSERSAKLV